MKTKSARTKLSSKTDRESLVEKYKKMIESGEYVPTVADLEDGEIMNSIFPAGKPKKLVRDSVPCDQSTMEFGPIPLGYRAVPPSHLLNLRGPIGKALKHFGARNFFLGDQVNAWLDQNCFINKADCMPGDDAVAAGYSFDVHGKKDKKLVDMLDQMFHVEHFNLDQSMREFEHNKRCFGAAIMVPCFEEEDVDMENPLIDWGQLKGKTFLGWTNIEPYYISPYFEPGSRELNDPTYKFYMDPTHWQIYGSNDSDKYLRRIHRSWIFFRRNIITSKIYQPMYKWQGPSIPQMITERLYSAEVCANESSMLLRSKRSFVMEADVRKMAMNPEYARKFLRNCAANADNWGIRVVPRNSNAKQMDSYLSECMPLTTAQYGILCAEISIPTPKFMMAQLTGFANSGNYEVKLYAQQCKILHTTDLEPIVKMTAKIATACDGRPTDFDVKFGDIDVPTVTERAEILYEEARALKFIEEAKAFKRGEKSAGTHHGTGEDVEKKSDDLHNQK